MYKVLERIPRACSELEKSVSIAPVSDGLRSLDAYVAIELPFVIEVMCAGEDAEVVKMGVSMWVALRFTQHGGRIWFRVRIPNMITQRDVLLSTLTLRDLLILHWLEREAGVVSMLIKSAENVEKAVAEYINDLVLVDTVMRLISRK